MSPTPFTGYLGPCLSFINLINYYDIMYVSLKICVNFLVATYIQPVHQYESDFSSSD